MKTRFRLVAPAAALLLLGLACGVLEAVRTAFPDPVGRPVLIAAGLGVVFLGGMVFLIGAAARRGAEDALRQSEAQLLNALKIAKLGSWELDVPSGMFTFTDSFYAIFRTTAQDMGGYQMSIADYAGRFVHPEDAPLVGLETQKALEADDPHFSRYLEHRMLYADGSVGHIAVRFFIVKDRRGKTIKTYGVNQDITERKRAEEARCEALSRFSGFAEASQYGMGMADLEGRIVYANPTLARMLGEKSPGDCFGKHFPTTYYPPAMTRRLQEEVMPALTQQGHWHGELELQTADGRQVPTDENYFVIRDEHGRARYFADILTDITERKKAEEQQAQLLQQLSAINQELKDFAYVVSHDLKAPLRAIKTLADWLTTDYQDKLDEQGRETLRLMGGRVNRMQSLIDGVLQYSRIGRTEQTVVPVDLRQLLPQIIDDLGVPAHIALHVPAELPTVAADQTRITQIFQNLLSNAIKYMDKPQGQITVTCVAEEGFWKFGVVDNGPGIAQKDFERIFKLFQTLTRRDDCESTGVGLTVTKKIVEMYGGRIWVESEVGRGSTFFFTFPQATGKATAEMPQPCTAGV